MNIFRLLATALWILAATIPASVSASFEQQWNFRVFLDDREIGYHRFVLNDTGKLAHLTSEARFKVRFLGIPLYSYTHDDSETWEDGCLHEIVSVTDDNGEQYRVDGSAEENGFVLKTGRGRELLPSCVSTFSYWDKSILGKTRLLNSQTGKYLDVSSRFQGKEMLDTGRRQVPALRYRLMNPDFNIDIWYSENDEWLALQSTTEGGRVLRYLIE